MVIAWSNLYFIFNVLSCIDYEKEYTFEKVKPRTIDIFIFIHAFDAY